jgi:hypothetical protein
MAIDPTVSLNAGKGVTQFNPMEASGGALNLVNLMQKLDMQPQMLQQKLASDRASQAATEASTAGQVMLNEQTRRENQARVRLAEITNKNSKIDPKTGKINIDHESIADQAAQEGYDPGIVFGFMQKASETAQGKLKTADEKQKFAMSVLGTANNLLRTQTDPKQANAIAGGAVKITSDILGQDLARQYAGQFWNLPPEMQQAGPDMAPPDPKFTGNYFIEQAKRNAASSISPQQAVINRQRDIELGTHQTQVAQTGRLGGVGTESLATSGPAVEAMRAQVIAANPNMRDRVANMSMYEMTNTPGIRELVTSNIVPSATKGEFAKQAAERNTKADVMDACAKAAKKVGIVGRGTTIQNILQGVYDKKLLADPNFNEYVTKVREAQQAGIPLEESMGPASISQYATSKAGDYRTQGKTLTRQSTSPTFTQAGAETETLPEPAAAPKATTKTVHKPGENIIKGDKSYKVLTPQEAMKLKPGTKFLAADGEIYTR